MVNSQSVLFTMVRMRAFWAYQVISMYSTCAIVTCQIKATYLLT